jgi:hypothetical protein
MKVQAVLCWSEYYNGKWQPTKTSDVTRPVTLFDKVGPFDRDRSDISTDSLEGETALRIKLVTSFFDFYNTHSLPVPMGDKSDFTPRYNQTFERFIYESNAPLNIDYRLNEPSSEAFLTRHLFDMKSGTALHKVEPSLHDLQKPWNAPFFLEDSRHVFFVTTAERRVTIPDWQNFGIHPDSGIKLAPAIPPLVLKVDPEVQVKPRSWSEGGPIGPHLGLADPAPMRRFVTEDAYIRQGIGTTGPVTYGDQQIGPSGAITDSEAGI